MIVHLMLEDHIAKHLRNDMSWDHNSTMALRWLLKTWLRAGLPPNNGKLYEDSNDDREYPQTDLQHIDGDQKQRNKVIDRLVAASTLAPFLCGLHKLIVDVMGGRKFGCGP